MISRETASHFHHRMVKDNSEPGQFTIYKTEGHYDSISLPHNRRDFYKISLLIEGEGILSYADRSFHIKNNTLAFFNPIIPYSWQPLSKKHSSYSCLFTEDFIHQQLKVESLSKSTLFKINGNHVLIPDDATLQFLTAVFERMNSELQSNYVHKYKLLRNYVQIILHEALKISPVENAGKTSGSYARLSAHFMDLLERQFPLVSPRTVIRFRNANQFANHLSVHTNHLNRVLKETTGKTTTELISENVTKEAKALLLHSDWDIAEIGYSLGFEHASNFNIFFKKQTGQTPKHFRKQSVVIS